MKDTQAKERFFIELRAQGLPLAKIAAEDVSLSANAMKGKISRTVVAAARAKGSQDDR
jgi:hypothetical protein